MDKNNFIFRRSGHSVNCEYWNNLSDEAKEVFAQQIFDEYRTDYNGIPYNPKSLGYPYYPTDHEYRVKEFEKLKSFDFSTVLTTGDTIRQTMHGLGLAWSYFPHASEVECANMMSPLNAFCSDIIFKKIIHKRLKMGTYISDSGIRKMIKVYTGVQGVSNFRPTAAAAIYKEFAPNGVVWDPSGGWGGRMLGAIIAGVDTYVTTEPAALTVKGLKELAEDFAGDMKYEIIQSGSEDYVPESNRFDLCFTSPPYFNLERYSDEDSQSYKKFSNKQLWIDGFLASTLKNCYKGTKPNKLTFINMADPKGKNGLNLEDEIIRVAKLVGFKYEGMLKLALSNPTMKNKLSPFKFEPVFIFRK